MFILMLSTIVLLVCVCVLIQQKLDKIVTLYCFIYLFIVLLKFNDVLPLSMVSLI